MASVTLRRCGSRCTTVIDEIDRLEKINLKTINKNAPHIYGQLKSDAEDDYDDPAAYLEEHEGGATSYVAELYIYCRKQIEEASKRPYILALAEEVRAKRLVLPPETLAVFSRYQTTLDNQIYKALKALRESQTWRLKTLEASPSIEEPKDTLAA